MKCSKIPNGTLLAREVRNSSETTGLPSPKTIEDLLIRLREDPPNTLPMLCSTAARLSDYLGKCPNEMTIDEVAAARNGFRPFLIDRKYKPGAVKSYVNYVRIFLDCAAKCGWNPDESVPEAWRGVMNLAEAAKCKDFVMHFARLKASPNEVTLSDSDELLRSKIGAGYSYAHTVAKINRFWRVLRQLGRTDALPKALSREAEYGIRLDQFPDPLKDEVQTLLKWKQAAFALGRPKTGRLRPVTAKLLEGHICRLYGFAVNVRQIAGVVSLPSLIDKALVSDFVEWSINERGIKGEGVLNSLKQLYAAIRYHSTFASVDLSWFKPLMDSIPTDGDDEKRKERKGWNYLEYQKVEAIPEKIRAERNSLPQSCTDHAAHLAMYELLIKLLLVFAWRQLNVRNCRIQGEQPNLFKAKIEPYRQMDRPEWVIHEQERNPDAQIWQVHFSKDETKKKHVVHAVVPRTLIGLLEDYLHNFRHHLLRGSDPGTLFINRTGGPMTMQQTTRLVSRLVARHGGVRVTPHLFRDIVAFEWLKAHPKDFLTLSKILWHKDVQTTIRIYGGRFDESSGVCGMENWIEEREARSESK
jgi:integrase